MLNINSDINVYIANGTTDLRKSINGLSLIVMETFKLDPFSKSLFVFCNRKKDKIKILQWDHNGFWLHYKRLESDVFLWPSKDDNGEILKVSSREFRWLLDGLSMNQRNAYKEIAARQII